VIFASDDLKTWINGHLLCSIGHIISNLWIYLWIPKAAGKESVGKGVASLGSSDGNGV
jgi:hypothetical protein